MNPAIVIIPTTGCKELENAIVSVMEQSIQTDVLIIFDGVQFDRPLLTPRDSRIHKLVLPFNTGKGRTENIKAGLPRHWYGARVMIAASYIVNNPYVMVLDQDNWLEKNHVESCMEALDGKENPRSLVAYSLRNIFRKDGSYVCRDDCESLGKHEGVSGHLIDTSCYFYKTDFLMQTAHMWLWGWGSDRVYLRRLLDTYGDEVLCGTGRYTMNYRLGGNVGSVREELFNGGNKIAHERFGKTPLPWAVE